MVVALHSLADVTLDTAWQVGFRNSSITLKDDDPISIRPFDAITFSLADHWSSGASVQGS